MGKRFLRKPIGDSRLPQGFTECMLWRHLLKTQGGLEGPTLERAQTMVDGL